LEKQFERFIRKLDKTLGSQPGSPEKNADDLLGTDQPGPDNQGD